MLTDHQKKHLNAVIKDTTDHSESAIGAGVANEMAKYHDVDTRDYQDYLDFIREAAQAILDNAIWPDELKNPYEIHDYLEENKTFRTFDGGLNG